MTKQSRYREALSSSDGEVIVLRLGSNMHRLSRKALEQRAAYELLKIYLRTSRFDAHFAGT